MVSATLSFFPAFSSVYSAYLSSALSKGQGSFFIQPMKATHKQKDLLHHLPSIISQDHPSPTWPQANLTLAIPQLKLLLPR